MLSDKMITCGEALKPNEEKIRGFLGKKPVKLAICGAISAVFIYLTFYFSIHIAPVNSINRVLAYILGGLIFLVMFIGIGNFFANIGKPSIKKYVIADATAMVVIMPTVTVLTYFCSCDLEWLYSNFWSVIWGGLAEGLVWFGIPMALSILFGRFAIHKKT